MQKLLESIDAEESTLTFHQKCYNNYTHAKTLCRFSNVDNRENVISQPQTEQVLEGRKSSRKRDRSGNF